MTTPSAGAPRPLAAIGRRVLAVVIDGAIVSVLLGVVYGGFLAAITAAAAGGDAGAVLTLTGVMGLAVLALAVGWLLVLSALQSRGGSIGQRVAGVLVVRTADATTIPFGAALGRNLVFAAAGSIIIGYFSPLLDSSGRRQGWHDKVVKAVVVDSRSAASAPATTAVPPATSAFPAAPPAPVAPSAPVSPAAETPSWLSSSLPLASVAPPTSGSPFAAPGPAAPAPPVAPVSTPPVSSSGLVSEVPGITHDGPVPRAEAAAAAPAPAAAPPAVAPASPAAAAGDDAAIDETRLAPPRRETPVAWAIVWDDGTEHPVAGHAVFGRNPDPVAGVVVFAVDDASRSLSKTHFDARAEARGLLITDRRSTNGTSVGTGADLVALTPGVPTPVDAGAVVTIGDRWFRVERRG